MAHLEQTWRREIAPRLMRRLGYQNPMQTPRLVKITLNMGLGADARDRGSMTAAMDDLTLIAGQRPSVTRARKSIAGFGIRGGWPIGCRVTLRRARMYGFFERLVNVAIPRIRDFRGLSRKSFDGRGNFSLGIAEHIVFPEIDYDKIERLRGLDVAITTSATSDEEAGHLLAALNFPFKD